MLRDDEYELIILNIKGRLSVHNINKFGDLGDRYIVVHKEFAFSLFLKTCKVRELVTVSGRVFQILAPRTLNERPP